MAANARPKTVDRESYCSAPPFVSPLRPSREVEARRKREPLSPWRGEPRVPEECSVELTLADVKPDVKPDITTGPPSVHIRRSTPPASPASRQSTLSAQESPEPTINLDGARASRCTLRCQQLQHRANEVTIRRQRFQHRTSTSTSQVRRRQLPGTPRYFACHAPSGSQRANSTPRLTVCDAYADERSRRLSWRTAAAAAVARQRPQTSAISRS